MKRHPWIASVFLALLPLLSLVLVRSSRAAELDSPLPLEPEWLSNWQPALEPLAQGPVLRALDPEEAERLLRLADEPKRPTVRYEEAILPNPTTGRELVDRTVGIDIQQGQSLAGTDTIASSPKMLPHQRVAAPNFVLPGARGV